MISRRLCAVPRRLCAAQRRLGTIQRRLEIAPARRSVGQNADSTGNLYEKLSSEVFYRMIQSLPQRHFSLEYRFLSVKLSTANPLK